MRFLLIQICFVGAGSVLLSGCRLATGQEVLDRIDVFCFSKFEWTLFMSPQSVTTRELHFDSGLESGKTVLIEGFVVERGDHGTHLVLKDDFGRLLVVTTEVDDLDQSLSSDRFDISGDSQVQIPVKVLGRVERGKKGLPFLLAKSIMANHEHL